MNTSDSRPSDSRFPGLQIVSEYFQKGIPGALDIAGVPTARLVVDPARRAIGFRVPADGPLPDVTQFSNIEVRDLEDDQVVWNELLFLIDSDVGEAYHVICGTMDRIQIDRETFRVAVNEMLASLEDLLDVRGGLSDEKRIGLFGELLTYLAHVDKAGALEATRAWRGADEEEHDFGLHEMDVEIKTTSMESRRHWISSATQLKPATGRPLRLLSIQVTPSGAESGWTLPELVAEARARSGDHIEALNRHLHQYGYRDRDADLYFRRWRLRSTPLEFIVDDSFPALTPERIHAVVPDAIRVVDVGYRIDLTGMPAASPTIDFGALVPTGGFGD